ncbi:MAG: hypothetical protein ACYTHJ_21080 [Planctomycetota bacterium]|jgi:F0F1-type ATP synthase membrane subunit b/b'
MQKSISMFVFVGVIAVSALGWMALPALQRSERTVDNDAARLLERARWLVHQHEHGLSHKSMLLDDLAGVSVDVDLDDADALLDASTDEYQESLEQGWDQYQPQSYARAADIVDGGAVARGDRVSVGNLAGSIRDGVRHRNGLLDDNEKLLEQAMRAVDEALAVQHGDASSRDYAEANRLKGVIYFHQGLRARHESRRLRNRIGEILTDLGTLGIKVAALRQTPVDTIGGAYDEQIAALKSRRAELMASASEAEAALREAESKVTEMEGLAHAARDRAERTLKEMDRTRERGVDFSDPNGGLVFAAQMQKLSDVYREASREAAGYEFGTMPNAEIDQTGNLVYGRYLENGSEGELVVRQGALHFRNRRDALKIKSDGLRASMASVDGDIQLLEELKTTALGRADDANATAAAMAGAATTLLEEYAQVQSDAWNAEDEAVELFKKADARFKSAASATDAWVRNGADTLREISDTARDAAAENMQAKSGWLGGHIRAQKADAILGSAWCYLQRYRNHRAVAEFLGEFGNIFTIPETDAKSELANAEDARAEAVALVESAVADLEKAHRDAGKHWTFVAQLAGANDLMVLLGYDAYVADAIEAYQSAIASREAEGYSQKYARRLAELQAN